MAVTLAFVVLALGAAELGFRSIVPSLSANSRVLAEAPDRAARIAASDATTVLVLGNSISGEGIDAGQLRELLGAGVELEHQPADTTVVRDWYFEYRNQFVGRGAAPDWLVLPVGDAAPLRRVNARTEDLMFSFARWRDLDDLYRRADERGVEAAFGLVAAKASALYGFRGRLQKRVLVTIAPGYEGLREAMRARGSTFDGEDVVSQDEAWARLLAAEAAAAGTRVVVVAMPTNVIEGVLPARDRALAEELGWTVLEPAAGVEWAEGDRPDGLHLEAPARARFTAMLAPALSAVLETAPP